MLLFYILKIFCFNPAIVSQTGAPLHYEPGALLYGYLDTSVNQFVVIQTQPVQNDLPHGTIVYEANPEVSRQVAGTNHQNVYPPVVHETDVVVVDKKEPVKSKPVEDNKKEGSDQKKSKENKKSKTDEDNGVVGVSMGCVVGTIIAIWAIQ